MSAEQPTIIYTLTDEAPLLATYAFLPIVRAFAEPAGIKIEASDISVAARILAEFPDYLTEEQRVPDNLAELGRLTQLPDTNIIKLPNISASVPQLVAAIKELQDKGYAVPDYPADPKTDQEKAIKERYARCLGSAVNPVLRQGNSDRRAPKAVKEYARKHPHSMGEWSMASRTHVAHMRHGDFYAGEKSMTLDRARNVRMELLAKSGKTIVLKPEVPLDDGDVIDSMFMSKKALCDFYEEQMQDAFETGVMFSLHVKATMMKVSHPSSSATRSGSSTRTPSPSTRSCSTTWASTSTMACPICTARSSRCRRRNATRSSRTYTVATNTAPSSRWSIRPEVSPTSTRRAM